MPATVRSFGSGSSGNAVLVETGDAAVLIDCGVGPRALLHGLSVAGRSPDQLSGLLVTHEHIDHVRSLAWVTKRGVPVVATGGTAQAASIAPTALRKIADGCPTTFDGIRVVPVAVSHDAAEPCGYYLEMADARITIVTDLGCANDALIEPIAQSDLVILEANHDEGMLRRGPYPAHLKRRVLSDEGHLSNLHCGDLLVQSLSGRSAPVTIWLAHLSQVNNTPAVAVSTVQRMVAPRVERFTLTAMPRHGCELRWRSDDTFVATPVNYQLELPGI